MRQAIFIGYRRADTADVAGRLYDALSLGFGEGKIFKDVDSIPVGADFAAHIAKVLPRCRVFLALIGPEWASARDAGGARRIDDPRDLVRVELETALATPKLLVVPVLVNGARMPGEHEVPASLRPLLSRHAAILRGDPDFKNDVARLVQALRDHLRTGRLNLQALGGAARVAANAAGLSGWVALAWVAVAGLGVTAAVPQLRDPIVNAATSVLGQQQHQQQAPTPDTIVAAPSAPPAALSADTTQPIAETAAPPPPESAPQSLGNGLSVVLVSLVETGSTYVATLDFQSTQTTDAGIGAAFFYHNGGYYGQMVLTDGAGGSCASSYTGGTVPTIGDNDNDSAFRTIPASGRTRQTIVFEKQQCDSALNARNGLAISGTFTVHEGGARRSAPVFFGDVAIRGVGAEDKQ